MASTKAVHESLQAFAETVTTKMSQLVIGEPEDQLRAPFESFISDMADVLDRKIVCTGETPLPDRLGRPDYAVHAEDLLIGYVELKAPGVGATSSRFKGHNRDQFKRFSAIPNILYTDGNEWGLYRDGELVGKIVRLSGEVSTDGRKAVAQHDAKHLERLVRDFFSWQPFIPTGRNGKIDLKGFAEMLAPLCLMLREGVKDALKDPASPLVQLAEDWRQLLFPNATDGQFADAYAQTVTFSLLLGRSEGADPLTLASVETVLAAQHTLLSRALQILTDPKARDDIAAPLDLLLRVLSVVPNATLAGPEDPWLYFYEDFLAKYDPKLRKDAGAYYTPVEVVHCQVRLIDDLLVNRLGRLLGFANPDVITLDPAVGTGTYLLGVIEHALGRIEAKEGPGAVAGQAQSLASSLYGFEIMVGPYAVAELRISRALNDLGATLPADGTHVYLTDTLESPHAEPPVVPLFLKPISEQHEKALNVKSNISVIVCLGNPPYDRHKAATTNNKAITGGWVRWGDDGSGAYAILQDFLEPAINAGHGVRVHNLYNLYTYFWRWAMWKVFEHESSSGPGIISFISASSYIDGDAFCGMREHMRRLCGEIWILDLGGEGRGTRRSENVFAIQTPVAIAVLLRKCEESTDTPAKVYYSKIEGTRKEKLATLDSIFSLSDLEWSDCADDWQAPFRPEGEGDYFTWPLLTDLMPWQQSGVKAGRTWVISSDQQSLKTRWRVLFQAKKNERKNLFKDSPTGRKAHQTATQLPPSQKHLKPVSDLAEGNQSPTIGRYAFRSFDRQYIFKDARLLDRPSPNLWRTHSNLQVYVTSLLNHPLGNGPAITACALIPDLHHFRGSYGAKEVFPFYRSADNSSLNINTNLLETLSEAFKFTVTPEDFLAYIFGVLAQPAFTSHFEKDLGTRELRVPLTKTPEIFNDISKIGAHLIWLHTYGSRFIPKNAQKGQIPPGAAKCIKAIPGNELGYPESFNFDEVTQTLTVGEGKFSPVTSEVHDFEVSGMKVVQSWLKYRMRKGAGKKSSPLDDIRPKKWTSQFTTELLELLWVLEATVNCYPEQAKLLEAIIASECFRADELPQVPDIMRKPPKEKAPIQDLYN